MDLPANSDTASAPDKSQSSGHSASSSGSGAFDRRVEGIIGNLLRTGVLLAAAVVFIGGILFLVKQGSSPTEYHAFHGEPGDLRHVSEIFHQALACDPRGIIQLGILLLIGTPIARVIFTVFAFGYERDWTYVVITLVVLGVLIYSVGPWHR